MVTDERSAYSRCLPIKVEIPRGVGWKAEYLAECMIVDGLEKKSISYSVNEYERKGKKTYGEDWIAGEGPGATRYDSNDVE